MNFISYEEIVLLDKQAFRFDEYFSRLANEQLLAEKQLTDSHISPDEHTDMITLRKDYLMRLARYCYLNDNSYMVEHGIAFEKWQTPFFSKTPFTQEKKCRSRVTIFTKKTMPIDVFTFNGYLAFIHKFQGGDILHLCFGVPVYNIDPEKNESYFLSSFLKLDSKGLFFSKNPAEEWLRTMFPNEGRDMMFSIVEDTHDNMLKVIFSIYKNSDDFREGKFLEHKRVDLPYDQLLWQPYTHSAFYQILYTSRKLR